MVGKQITGPRKVQFRRGKNRSCTSRCERFMIDPFPQKEYTDGMNPKHYDITDLVTDQTARFKRVQDAKEWAQSVVVDEWNAKQTAAGKTNGTNGTKAPDAPTHQGDAFLHDPPCIAMEKLIEGGRYFVRCERFEDSLAIWDGTYFIGKHRVGGRLFWDRAIPFEVKPYGDCKPMALCDLVVIPEVGKAAQ